MDIEQKGQKRPHGYPQRFQDWHVWGISPAADLVRALVSGLPGDKSRLRNFLVLQAFIDDSADGTRTKVLVLSGYVANAETWVGFSRDWEKHLKDCQLEYFKLNEFGKEETWKIASFYRIIEQHEIKFSMDAIIDIPMLNRCIKNTDWPPGTENVRAYASNPYFMASKILMQHLFNHAPQMGITEKIDLIFDDQSEKAVVLDAWDYFKECFPPQTQALMGDSPSFKSEKTFLPLQAADLVTGYVRRAEEIGPSRDKNIFPWKVNKPIPRIVSYFEEDLLMKELAYICSEENYQNSKASFLARSS